MLHHPLRRFQPLYGKERRVAFCVRDVDVAAGGDEVGEQIKVMV
jgi:hypothetical protein